MRERARERGKRDVLLMSGNIYDKHLSVETLISPAGRKQAQKKSVL